MGGRKKKDVSKKRERGRVMGTVLNNLISIE